MPCSDISSKLTNECEKSAEDIHDYRFCMESFSLSDTHHTTGFCGLCKRHTIHSDRHRTISRYIYGTDTADWNGSIQNNRGLSQSVFHFLLGANSSRVLSFVYRRGALS